MRPLALISALLFFLAGSAAASTVYFTDSIFASATGQKSFSPPTPIDGIDLTLTALPNGAKLYWDGTDGFGVKYFYEKDEIEFPEMLKISFATPVYLSQVFITDLFFENGYQERGFYKLNNGDWIGFPGSQILTDGSYALSIDSSILVNCITFTAPGIVWDHGIQLHEFSVARLVATAVPIPAAAWLLGTGMVGLIGLRRKLPS